MPDFPVMPKQGQCDCLSPLIDNASPWRFNFVEASSTGASTVFVFSLGIQQDAPCYPVTYRDGNCCNSTLDAVSINMETAVWTVANSYQYTKVYDNNGKLIPAATGILSEYGLTVQLPAMLYVDTIPVGESYTIEIALDATQWGDTSRFPCHQSRLIPGFPSCDYFVHGWQTATGDSHTVIVDTLDNSIPQCCPEGVVQFTGSQAEGTCNPFLSDSPWRVTYDSSVSAAGLSSITFDVDEIGTSSNLFPGGIACGNTNVEEIRLYVNQSTTSALTGVLVGGSSVSFAILSDPDTFVSIPSAFVVGGGASQIVLQFSSEVAVADVCPLSLGAFSVCNYILIGQSGQCCTKGDFPTL